MPLIKSVTTVVLPQAGVVLQDVVVAQIVERKGRGAGSRVRAHGLVVKELTQRLVDVQGVPESCRGDIQCDIFAVVR